MPAVEKKEKKPTFSGAVGVIPLHRRDDGEVGVVLGLRNEDGKWTPIAGGLEQGETELDALSREWNEETGLTPRESLKIYPLPLPNVSPREEQTTVGYTYVGEYIGPNLPHYPDTEEVAILDSFPPTRLKHLLLNQDRLFRPDLNWENLAFTLMTISPEDSIGEEDIKNKLLDEMGEKTQRMLESHHC